MDVVMTLGYSSKDLAAISHCHPMHHILFLLDLMNCWGHSLHTPFFMLWYYLLLVDGNDPTLKLLLLTGQFGSNVFGILLLPWFLVTGYDHLIYLHSFRLI